MIGFAPMGTIGVNGIRAVSALLIVFCLALCLTGCSGSSIFGGQPDSAAANPPAAAPDPPAQAPPPIDLAGRWQLSAAAGGACFMTLGEQANGAAGGTSQGSIAPEGGCPGNFFTSRKWTFEHGMLIIHDFKGRQLAQLSYLGGHFEGQDKSGGALTLSKPQ
jgi:Protease inhibitor Inh